MFLCYKRNEDAFSPSKNEVNKEGSRVICNPVCLKGCRDRVTYDSRPFLVHLVFADLSSLHPSSFHEIVFILVPHIF